MEMDQSKNQMNESATKWWPGSSIKTMFNNLVYFEQETLFGGTRVIENNGEQVVKYSDLQRAVGILEGVIKEFDDDKKSGIIEVDGHYIPISDDRKHWKKKKHSLNNMIGEKICCSFWPSQQRFPYETSQEALKIQRLRISNIHKKSEDLPLGYIEAIGKLEKIYSDGFVISIWSKSKTFFFIPFSGTYPYPDEEGEFVKITGKFDSKTQSIQFKETNSITFVPPEEAQKILKKQKSKPTPTKPKNPGAKKNKTESASIDWNILTEETERAMINAKIKIVLKKLPEIKKAGNMIWIPLENQPKAVPGGIELSKTPLDLLITQKMWNKAQKKADTTPNPIHIIEALIGIKKNKIAAIASGIQVTEGKAS